MAQQRFTQAQVIAALKATKGMLTVAARRLQCSPQTVQNYLDRYPAVAEARRLEREAFLDIGELALMKKVQDGDIAAICFLLKTQGKARGYVERSELTGADGSPIEVEDVTRLSNEERATRVNRLLTLAEARRQRAATRESSAPQTHSDGPKRNGTAH